MPATAAARRISNETRSAPPPARRATRPQGPARARSGAATRVRREAPKRRRGTTPAAGLMIPAVAVGRATVAVGGLADSGFVVRMTRSRLWIGAIGLLLAGIVGVNVYALSASAASSDTAAKADALEREISSLRAGQAGLLSNKNIQDAAGTLGLVVPAAGDIGYLEPSYDDAAIAAKRLNKGEIIYTGP